MEESKDLIKKVTRTIFDQKVYTIWLKKLHVPYLIEKVYDILWNFFDQIL